jgi:hypothetical protein
VTDFYFTNNEGQNIMSTMKWSKPAIAAAMLLLCIEAGNAKTEMPLPVTQSVVHKFVEIALNDLTQQKGDSPLKDEIDQLKENIDKKLDSDVDTDDNDSKTFSADLTHYIREGSHPKSKAERTEHLQHCIICNRVVHYLFENIGVQAPQFQVPFSAVYLYSSAGASWYKVDPVTGLLYRIIDNNGTTLPTPDGQLVQQNGEWWATNGWVWLGPIRQSRP